MKYLSHRCTRSLVLAGAPGTGKTTLAKALCTTLEGRGFRYLRVEVDQLRAMLSGPRSSEKGWLPLALAIIQAALGLVDVIVIEGLFYEPASVAALTEVMPGAIVLLLEAPLDVCIERNASRSHHSDMLEVEEVARLSKLQRPSHWLRVDSNRGIEHLVDEVCRQIVG